MEAARRWQRCKFEAGWAGIGIPKEFGGRGGTIVEAVIFRQEEATFDVPQDALAVGLGWIAPALIAFGDYGQKTRYLTPLLAGDVVWCQLFSEPDAGSDLAGLATRASLDGEEWTITGRKVWTTFAHLSDFGLCIARNEAGKHEGLTAFIVDMKAEGVSVRPIRQMTGGANFNEVFLNGVRVTDDNRVGAVGDGWRVVIATFLYERYGAGLIGRGAYQVLCSMAVTVSGAGRHRRRLVESYIADRIIEFNGFRTLTALGKGGFPGVEGSIAKLLATRMLDGVYDQALDQLGPAGVAGEQSALWQAAFLGVPGLRIGGGTDQIQLNIIAERILGLPRDV